MAGEEERQPSGTGQWVCTTDETVLRYAGPDRRGETHPPGDAVIGI